MLSGLLHNGRLSEAMSLFEMMPERNVVSWTAMICGLADTGRICEARRPNRETFISLAYACAGMGFPHPGKQLHAQVIVNSWEYDDYDGRLSKSLIHMYSLFGIMDFAHYIFNKNINNCDVQSFNSLIKGYIRIGRLEEAQNLFETVPFRDEISWTSMINAYLSVGEISKASYLFYNMPHRDAVAWTAMISGYVQNELSVEATYLFLEMRAHYGNNQRCKIVNLLSHSPARTNVRSRQRKWAKGQDKLLKSRSCRFQVADHYMKRFTIQTCTPSGKIRGRKPPPGQCVEDNDSLCCVPGRLYTTYRCSPAVTNRTKATLTLNSFEKGGDGGAPSECDNQYHSNDKPVVALSTGWYNKGSRCLNYINIYSSGKSVRAMVVDECDSSMGCDKDHDYQPPCGHNIVDASQAVWKALGVPRNQWGEIDVYWSDA
ncbi:hypothetical protein Patl1_01195 [Pistacia atlantica]|uniref:Uncharacterized protein n=1 Tax=Pistacia atlantica TaxID=434234 RepID=A0ACC1CCI1_9ROSI|nr:hypothetical protein Patl1_01195 [Pistacia atlantica]